MCREFLQSSWIMCVLMSRFATGLISAARPMPSKAMLSAATVLDVPSPFSNYVSTSSSSFSFGKKKEEKADIVFDPLIVCGPSGVGKGTIIQQFMTHQHHRFGFSVSHTTRNPRPGEINGLHYHFCTHEEMEMELMSHGQTKFLEYAKVHENWYGTSWKALKDVQEQGKRCLLDIDVQGVQSLKKQTVYTGDQWQPRFIFIAPPSLELLAERLSLRGTEDEASLRRRTAMAQTELEYGLQEGNFDGIIINDDLDTACREFTKMVNELYSLQN